MGTAVPTSKQLAREVRRRKRLQGELSVARRNLALRTAELEGSQRRLTEAEQKLRVIHGSPTYRMAKRIWRIRSAARGRLRSRADTSGSGREPSVHMAGLTDGSGPQEEGATSKPSGDRSRSLAAVWLLGGLDSRQLVRMLEAITRSGPPASRLLVITDSDAFQALDGFGCPYEFIPPRDDWEQRLGREGSDYAQFVRRRLAAIGEAHGLSGLPLGQPIALN